jgi:hypothetical protein
MAVVTNKLLQSINASLIRLGSENFEIVGKIREIFFNECVNFEFSGQIIHKN